MTFAVIFTSLFIALSGYIVNEKNADVLLAGYNTMSKEEKNRFDLINYLKFFRKFMLNVSLYTAIIYAITVCIPWPYFIIISNKRFIK